MAIYIGLVSRANQTCILGTASISLYPGVTVFCGEGPILLSFDFYASSTHQEVLRLG